MSDAATIEKLQAELDRLRSEVAERETVIAEREAAIAGRDAVITRYATDLARVTTERDHLAAELRAVLAKTFGRRSEKLDARQQLLFAEEIERVRRECADDVSEPLPTTRGTSKKKRTPHREPLPEHLERRPVVHDVPEAERGCPCCGEDRPVIARETSERLEIDPPQLWVHQDVQLVRACIECRNQIQRAEKPYAPIERSIAGPSLLAWLVLSKFVDHLPLHRLEKILKRSEVHLAKSTQSDLLRRTAELLEPLVELMWAYVRGSPVIHTDDTTMLTLDRGRKARGEGNHDAFRGNLWPYLGRSGVPCDLAGAYVVFKYTTSRAGHHVTDALGDWSGTLQADCFTRYVSLDRDPTSPIMMAACWAHARRGFHDARVSDPDRAMRAMAMIGELYAVERVLTEAEDMRPEDILSARSDRSRPMMTALMMWIEAELSRPEVLPKSPIGKAMAYTLGHREQLERYLDDGRLAIDNSIAERTIRPIAVGRKNFLFAGSTRGGRTMATLMSVVGSAQLHGLDPSAYLRDVISRIKSTPESELASLLPDRWVPLREPGSATQATTTVTLTN